MTAIAHSLNNRRRLADQNTIDLGWERCQEQALLAYRNNQPGEARGGWARALEIAERYFERGDPRLAASRTNHAFALLRQNQIHQANLLLEKAVVAWEESWRWVPLMTPSAGQGDADPEPYDVKTQEAFYALIRQGQAMTESLLREGRLADGSPDDWFAVKPKSLNDIRRLYAAIFLMPSNQQKPNRRSFGRRAA
jgi:hypothetical protein